MTEKQLQKAVLELARRLGWRVAHFRAAQVRPGVWATPVEADGAGFPDLVLVHHQHGLLVRELKVDSNKPSGEQLQWIASLALAGVDVAVWRDRDWTDGRVELDLRGQRLEAA